MPEALARRYVRAYGNRVLRFAGHATSLADLGEEVAPGLYGAELTYLVKEEWAQTAEDVLWRRSKLGLHLDEQARGAVATWLKQHVVTRPAMTLAVTSATGR